MTKPEYRFGVILIDYDGEVVMSLGTTGWATLAWPGHPTLIGARAFPPPPDMINTIVDGNLKYQVQEDTL